MKKRTRHAVALFFLKLACLALGLFLTACAFTQGFTRFKVTTLKPGEPLPMTDCIYVMLPHDYKKSGKVEVGSGLAVQKALQEALLGPLEKKVIAQTPQGLDEALSSARQAPCVYLVQIEILDWYDPPAFIQTAADRGEINIKLFLVENGKMLRLDNITCSGAAATVNHIGSYSPNDCLKPGMQKWATMAFH